MCSKPSGEPLRVPCATRGVQSAGLSSGSEQAMRPPFDLAVLRAKTALLHKARGEAPDRQEHQIRLSRYHRSWPPIFEWCDAQVPDGVLWSRHRDMESGQITLTF